MSYHRIPTRIGQPFHLLVERPEQRRRMCPCPGLGMHPSEMPTPFTPTTAFAQAVDPYTWRFSPPGAMYSPYGWGPDMNVGMPFNYTHHIGYERTPIPGARRVGPMYDVLPGMSGSWSGSHPSSGGYASLAGILAVL